MDTGDTAWIIVATALVLFMTLPGLAMFYAGLVRSKSALSAVMHCVSITALASVLWLVIGYALAFGDSQWGVIGGLDKVLFIGVGPDALRGSIPEIVFAMFQMTFAIITPALIVGAYVERIKFSAMLIISGAWVVLVYAPIAHWVWGGGWLSGLGVMDFAGGAGGPRERRCGGPGHRLRSRTTARLSPPTPAAPQSRYDRRRRGDAVGRLVRFQRR